jgi:hypothetical protein
MPGIDELGRKVKAKYPGVYDDLPDMEVGKRVKAKFPGSYDDFADVAPAQQQAAPAAKPKPNTLSVLKSFAQGAVGDTAAGIASAVAHPIDTIAGLGRRHGELLTNAASALEKGDYSSAAGYGMYGVLPIVGPAMEAANSKIFGDGDADTKARGVGNLAALVAGPQVAKGAARAVAPTMQRAGSALRASAEKQYGQVLNATTKGNKARSAEVVPDLIDRGVVAGTMKGLKNKAATQVERYGEAIDEAWAGLPEGTAVDVGKVIRSIETRATEQHTVPAPGGARVPAGPEAIRGLENSRALAETLREAAEKRPITDAAGNTTYMEVIPANTLRRLRQYFDGVSTQAGRFEGRTLKDQSSASAHAAAADAIRAELAADFPDIAKLNKEFNFWRKVDTVVGDTIARREGQATPLGQKLAGAAGMAGGFAEGGLFGGVLGKMTMSMVEKAITSPAWKTVSAVTKNKLANAIARGNREQVGAILSPLVRAGQIGSAARPPLAGSPALAEK